MPLGKLLILIGALLIVAGVAVTYGGRLPGDIAIRGKNVSFYFPIATCIVLSVVLSLLMWILRR